MMGDDRVALIWDDIHEFLGSDPGPASRKHLAAGEMRYTMGMHRYYLEGTAALDPDRLTRLTRLAAEHNLRLDEREPGNYVVFDRNNDYIGRAQHHRLILMPQKMPKDLFLQFISLYSA